MSYNAHLVRPVDADATEHLGQWRLTVRDASGRVLSVTYHDTAAAAFDAGEAAIG